MDTIERGKQPEDDNQWQLKRRTGYSGTLRNWKGMRPSARLLGHVNFHVISPDYPTSSTGPYY